MGLAHPGRRARLRSLLGAATLIAVGTAAAPGAGAAPSGFINGEAEAIADTFSVAVRQGNANIAIAMGSSSANYRDITGTAEARGLDMGVIQLLFGQQQCDGSPAILNPASFTAPSRVDSTQADSTASRRTESFMPGFGQDGPGESVGFQDATATKTPASKATTETPISDIWVLSMKNARTETSTVVKDGVREAHAVTTADNLKVLGGLFTFTKPRWEAIARSGATTTEFARFSFESATVLGFRRSAEDAMKDLAEFEKGLEELLTPFGIKFDLPTTESFDGRIRVTPMSFRVENMPIGADILAPLLGDLRPYREQMEKELLAEDCKNESMLLLMDILLGVLSGSGSLEVHAGGASAFTADTDFSAPPLDFAPPEQMVPGDSAPVVEAVTVEDNSITPVEDFSVDVPMDDFSTDLGTDFDDTSVFGDDFAAVPASAPTTSVKPKRSGAEYASAPAASSRMEDSTAGALAVAVGAVGLAVAIGLAGGERFLGRRTKRVIP